jgi:DNA-binding transcriptional regulator YhcF (GntR family)
MKWVFRGDRPIYAQIVEQIQLGILGGEYPPGGGIPSVRALALEAEVNPNTMQKALSELETQGLLNTHRTAGRTVTEDGKMIRKLKENMAKEHIRAFFEGMSALGVSREEALELLKAAVAENSGAASVDATGAANTANFIANAGGAGAATAADANADVTGAATAAGANADVTGAASVDATGAGGANFIANATGADAVTAAGANADVTASATGADDAKGVN